MTSKYWALSHIWKLDPAQQEQLDKYYLIHWQPSYFLTQLQVDLETNNLTLVHQEVEYTVRLVGFRLTDCVLDKEVRLSFRKHMEESKGIVLVMRNQKHDSQSQ